MTDPQQPQPGQNDTPVPPPYPTYHQPTVPYQPAVPQQPAPPYDPSAHAPAPYDTVPAAPYGQDPYAQPGGPAAPPGAYGVPVGGYQVPVGGYAVPSVQPARSRLIGALAMIAGILAFQIGEQVPIDQVMTEDGDVILVALAPVRDLVLGLEIVFWIGTVLGIAAIVFGIIAIAKNRGRGMGITAIVLAVLGSVGFFFVFSLMWGVGSAAGMA